MQHHMENGPLHKVSCLRCLTIPL